MWDETPPRYHNSIEYGPRCLRNWSWLIPISNLTWSRSLFLNAHWLMKREKKNQNCYLRIWNGFDKFGWMLQTLNVRNCLYSFLDNYKKLCWIFMDEHTNCNDADRRRDAVLYSRMKNGYPWKMREEVLPSSSSSLVLLMLHRCCCCCLGDATRTWYSILLIHIGMDTYKSVESV